VRSSLQQKQASEGNEATQGLVNQYAGTSSNPEAVSCLFAPQTQQQVAQAASQQTGLDAGTIMQLLPVIVPIVLNLLQSGSNTQNPQSGGNSVLNSFLDANGDGDINVADAIQLFSKYVGR
ncbi:MAG: DUF937 domain-containing protein, partial [Nodularia sp. (in: Bacteria)]